MMVIIRKLFLSWFLVCLIPFLSAQILRPFDPSTSSGCTSSTQFVFEGLHGELVYADFSALISLLADNLTMVNCSGYEQEALRKAKDFVPAYSEHINAIIAGHYHAHPLLEQAMVNFVRVGNSLGKEISTMVALKPWQLRALQQAGIRVIQAIDKQRIRSFKKANQAEATELLILKNTFSPLVYYLMNADYLKNLGTRRDRLFDVIFYKPSVWLKKHTYIVGLTMAALIFYLVSRRQPDSGRNNTNQEKALVTQVTTYSQFDSSINCHCGDRYAFCAGFAFLNAILMSRIPPGPDQLNKIYSAVSSFNQAEYAPFIKNFYALTKEANLGTLLRDCGHLEKSKFDAWLKNELTNPNYNTTKEVGLEVMRYLKKYEDDIKTSGIIEWLEKESVQGKTHKQQLLDRIKTDWHNIYTIWKMEEVDSSRAESSLWTIDSKLGIADIPFFGGGSNTLISKLVNQYDFLTNSALQDQVLALRNDGIPVCCVVYVNKAGGHYIALKFYKDEHCICRCIIADTLNSSNDITKEPLKNIIWLFTTMPLPPLNILNICKKFDLNRPTLSEENLKSDEQELKNFLASQDPSVEVCRKSIEEILYKISRIKRK